MQWQFRVTDRSGVVLFGPVLNYYDACDWASDDVLKNDRPLDIQASPDSEEWKRTAFVRPGPIGGPVDIGEILPDFRRKPAAPKEEAKKP